MLLYLYDIVDKNCLYFCFNGFDFGLKMVKCCLWL